VDKSYSASDIASRTYAFSSASVVFMIEYKSASISYFSLSLLLVNNFTSFGSLRPPKRSPEKGETEVAAKEAKYR